MALDENLVVNQGKTLPLNVDIRLEGETLILSMTYSGPKEKGFYFSSVRLTDLEQENLDKLKGIVDWYNKIVSSHNNGG